MPIHSFIHSSCIWFLLCAGPWLDNGSSLETQLRCHLLQEALLDPHPLLQLPLASPVIKLTITLLAMSSVYALGQVQKRAQKNVMMDKTLNR